MEIKVHYNVECPRVPNFLLIGDGNKIPISAISEDGLREIGKVWTNNLIARAKQMSIEEKQAKP